MSSKTIYAFNKTNKSLSSIFNVPYTYDADIPLTIYDWSLMEIAKQPNLGTWSTSYRDTLILATKNLITKRDNKRGREARLEYANHLIKQINREISYLLNRCREQYNLDYMNEVRALRKSKSLLLKHYLREMQQ